MSRVEERARELRERLAAIEHERWSDWQQYMHGLARADAEGNLVIPKALADRWSRQYHTAYADLTDAEKHSDMDQVDRYWPLIAPLVAAEQRLLALEERFNAEGDDT